MSALTLTTDEKKAIVFPQLKDLMENGLQTIELRDFVKKHFTYKADDGFEFQPFVYVANYFSEKSKKIEKGGTVSNRNLGIYEHFWRTGIMTTNDGKPVQKYKKQKEEYIEMRPCLAHKQMAVIDIDGIVENGDVMFSEVWDKIPEELRNSAFTVSRNKFLPHFIFYITDIPKGIKLSNYQDCLKGYKGDFLLNHCWERCDDPMFKVFNYTGDLTTISWNVVKDLINPESTLGKKINEEPKPEEPKPKKQKKQKEQSISDITDEESLSSSVVNIKCIEIQSLVDEIHKYNADYFAPYDMWIRLGFIIYNETNGSEAGSELFIEISKDLESTSGKRQNRDEVKKQYYKADSAKAKDKKLGIATLKKWLKDEKPEEEETEVTESDIRNAKVYLDFREKFEKTNFKLAGVNRFVRQSKDERGHPTINLYSPTEFSSLNADLDQPSFKIGNVTKSFYTLWIEDSTKRSYQSLKFDPTECSEPTDYQSRPIDEKFFNMFTGFPNYSPEAIPFTEDESDFLKLLKWLINDDRVYRYMLCWIASIIQRPEMKTKVAPVFYSETKGTGKNSVIDGIIAILGRLNCAMIESIEDITRNFNVHFCNKLFIYGDEINAAARKVVSRLKQIITRPTQNLERKGIDAIEINDFTNYAFTTNEESSFKIETGDRRFLMIHTREEQQTELSKSSYAEIKDPEKLKRLFAFFKNYDTNADGFKIGECPVISTKYKETLQIEDKPAYIQMIYNNPQRWLGRSYNSTDLFKASQSYAKENFLQSHYTLTKFGLDFKKYFTPTKTNPRIVYTFPFNETDMLKLLYNADPAYYRYVFELSENEEPDFTPPPTTEPTEVA